MSLNTAHANGGVLIHAGECILLFCDNVTMEFHGNDQPEFKGSKSGRLYLTTHRMVFNAKDSRDKMQSFSFPFVTLSNVELEQPMFGANFIKGKVRAQPNGNWVGEAKFKLMFKSGGAIDFGQAMLKAAHMASRNGPPRDAPPPYSEPLGPMYAAPPPAYACSPAGYYGWVPPTHAFPDAPPPNSVFMTDMPPPYPGINGYNGYTTAPTGGGATGYGMAPPAGAGAMSYGPPAGAGAMSYGPPAGAGAMSYGPPAGAGAMSYGMVPPSAPPSGGGAMGFNQPPNGPDAKAAEAAQSAYYDPNRPQCAYVPPPAYYESPPTYQAATAKKDQ